MSAPTISERLDALEEKLREAVRLMKLVNAAAEKQGVGKFRRR